MQLLPETVTQTLPSKYRFVNCKKSAASTEPPSSLAVLSETVLSRIVMVGVSPGAFPWAFGRRCSGPYLHPAKVRSFRQSFLENWMKGNWTNRRIQYRGWRVLLKNTAAQS